MELCAAQSFSFSTSVSLISSKGSTLYEVFSGCPVRPRNLFCFISLSIPSRRGTAFPFRDFKAGNFNGSISAALAVPVAEDVELAEQKERVEKNGFQLLGNKEKKELRAYAHSLGKDINVQQVGKLGITPNVITSISDALEANEIIKVKVLENCSSEQDEIIAQLEDGTGAQTVGKIGRTVLLYRASLKKLAATEKKAEKPKRRSRIAMSAGRSTVKSRRSPQ